MLTVEREQVLAYRLHSQHLDARLPDGGLWTAAGTCGVQDTPAGSARVALRARVHLSAGDLDRAFSDRELVVLWSVRGAPNAVPVSDIEVFTTGALPADEESFRVFLQGQAGEVDRWDAAPGEALERVGAAMARALGDGVLSKGALSTAVTAAVPGFAFWCRTCDADHVPEGLFRAAAMSAGVVLAVGEDDSGLTRTERWLGRSAPSIKPGEARAELARRYLHAYGPATPALFAEWTQRSRADARDAFGSVEDELVEVEMDGRSAFLLAVDEPVLAAPPQATGVRLLPPHDPYLQQRDRATLVPDKAVRSLVWRPVSGPGVVLVDGTVSGTWRARKRGTALAVDVRPLAAPGKAARALLEEEAEALAEVRGLRSVQLHVDA
ncbi:MAG: winged helix DNA-binding domain-containing protein [Actinomycetales bacterium]|nr:winged helix DNA-binding domain-containing protein [Actinomycetales bacterium]